MKSSPSGCEPVHLTLNTYTPYLVKVLDSDWCLLCPVPDFYWCTAGCIIKPISFAI